MEQAQVPRKTELADGAVGAWERVPDTHHTWRLPVDSGWLYKVHTMTADGHVVGMCMCFVPHPAMAPTMPAHVPVPEDAGWDPNWKGFPDVG